MGSFKVLLFGPAREAATPLWRQIKAWKGGGIPETGAVSSPTVTTGNSCVLWQQHCNLHWHFGAGDGQWRTHGGGLFGFGTVALKHQEKRLPHVFLKFGWDETLHHTIFWWELEEHPSCSYFASWFNPKKNRALTALTCHHEQQVPTVDGGPKVCHLREVCDDVGDARVCGVVGWRGVLGS